MTLWTVTPLNRRPAYRLVVIGLAALALAGCNDLSDLTPKHQKDLPERIVKQMKAKGMTRTSPIVVRVFKEEAVLEVWKRTHTGRYDLIASYEICKWSGQLGPKFIEGDRQAPEGFYAVAPGQMNPNSQYHLAFNTGFPNAFDRANGRTGTHLMVHGACSSAGCYSMTDEQMEEIYAFARDAFRGGQKAFQFQAYPFRMTPENMARYQGDPNMPFWRDLKVGYDLFELTKVPPKAAVCGRDYRFSAVAPMRYDEAPDPCADPGETASPALLSTLASYNQVFETRLGEALEQGDLAPPRPTIHGLQEAKLVADWTRRRNAGERVSREPPELTPPPPPTPEPVPTVEFPVPVAALDPGQPTTGVAAEGSAAAEATAAVQPSGDTAPAPETGTAVASVAGEPTLIDGVPVPAPNPTRFADPNAAPAVTIEDAPDRLGALRRLWPFSRGE